MSISLFYDFMLRDRDIDCGNVERSWLPRERGTAELITKEGVANVSRKIPRRRRRRMAEEMMLLMARWGGRRGVEEITESHGLALDRDQNGGE